MFLGTVILLFSNVFQASLGTGQRKRERENELASKRENERERERKSGRVGERERERGLSSYATGAATLRESE